MAGSTTSGTDFGGPLSVDGSFIDPMWGRGDKGSLPNGRTIYVCSIGGAGGSGGNGQNPNYPMASVGGTTGALAQLANPSARTYKGDRIVCLPGHVESIASADAWSDMGSASHFSIVGLGYGPARPTFNWVGATSTVLLDQLNVELVNLNLNLSGAVAATTQTVATPITVSAAGCRFAGCEINWGLDTNTGCGSVLGAIAVTAATRFRFENNYCPNYDTAGTLALALLALDGADDAYIVGNDIMGGTTSTTVGPVHFLTTASLRVRVDGNYVQNTRASSTKAITSAISGVTGVMRNNNLRVNSGILGFTVSANLSVDLYNNYTNNTLNKNGALDVGAGTSA